MTTKKFYTDRTTRADDIAEVDKILSAAVVGFLFINGPMDNASLAKMINRDPRGLRQMIEGAPCIQVVLSGPKWRHAVSYQLRKPGQDALRDMTTKEESRTRPGKTNSQCLVGIPLGGAMTTPSKSHNN